MTRFRSLPPNPFSLIGFALLAGTLARAPSARGQVHPPENVVLLKHLDRNEDYSGNWGYTSPTGVELAISGTASGTTFIDATDPINAHEVAFIPGPQSIWREMATYGTYCYIVTEAGGAGLQIVSLADPLNPVLVTTLNPPDIPFTRAHEIKIDQQTGILYAAGTNNASGYTGLVMLNLNPNPLLPSLRGTWPASGFSNDNYIHDLSIQNGVAYCAAIYVGTVFVLDVSQPGTPPVLGQWTYPDGFTHNTWPTADGNYLVTTDENLGGHLRMWDIRNLNQVAQTDEWISPTGALVHNAYIRGNYCFMAHYRDGLRVVSVVDPTNIVPVGWYDTHPEDGGGTRGAWGCYCFATDPNIAYISDRDSGTWILRFVPPAQSVEEPASSASIRPALIESFPNPFHPATTIRFQLPAAGLVNLRVVDAGGRTVRALLAGPLDAGSRSVVWDGRDDARRPVASGVYFIRLDAPGVSTTGRVVRTR